MEDPYSSSASNCPQIINFSCGDSNLFHQICQIPPHYVSRPSPPIEEFPSWPFPAHDKAVSASTSHSQAEKRRRDRINTQLGILRKLIPKSDKMDKAGLLRSVIEQVKELKEQAKEASKGITVPTEIDEVTVDELVLDRNKNILIRATVCCEDRPDVLPELIRAVKEVRLSIVRADIASVGGRVKSILILCQNHDQSPKFSLSAVKQTFNLALSRISSSTLPSNFRIRSKRQRFFLPLQQNWDGNVINCTKQYY